MVMRPFLGKHLPFLLGIRSQRVEEGTPYDVGDEQPLNVVIVPANYRTKANAGFSGINSSAGWIQASVDTIEDVGIGDVGGWPLTNKSSWRAPKEQTMYSKREEDYKR